MSAYDIKLEYWEVLPGDKKGRLPGKGAQIMAHDPLQDFTFPISFQCMGAQEVSDEVARLKKALDKIEAQARRKFRRHSEKVRAGREA